MAQSAVTGEPDDWRRVADRVVDRRLGLGLGQDELGVSKSVASNLENARQRSFARSSLARVARSLGWTPGSIELILRGDDPTAGPGAGLEAPARLAPDASALSGELRRLAQRVEGLAGEVADLRRAIEDRVGLRLAAAGGDVRGSAGSERERPRAGYSPTCQDDA